MIRAIRGYRPSWLEIIAIVLTAIATVWWIWADGWRGLLLATASIVFGFMAGDMLFDLWRRR